MSTFECRLILTDSDFIMQNHRVHGVSLMPGVVFLDIVVRMLAARGIAAPTITLRDIVFSAAVSTRPGMDREIVVTVEGSEDGQARAVVGRSRWLEAGRPRSGWIEHVRAELRVETRPDPPPVDLERLRRDALAVRDVEELYTIARQEGIVHGDPMKCSGVMHQGASSLLAELRLDPAYLPHDAQFHLHPAKLDASTIVAYGQTSFSDRQPFIPVYIEEFRAPRAAAGPCLVYVPRREVLAPSGDVIHSDCLLLDGEGRLVAELRKLTCKRIRHPALIERLVEIDAPREERAPQTDAATGLDRMRALLRARVAERLRRPEQDVSTSTGFYELGLDSVDLLELSEGLQQALHRPIYPTLLFEFSNVDELAAHLGPLPEARPAADEPAPPAAAPPAPSPSFPQSRVHRPVWESRALEHGAGVGGEVVLLGHEPASRRDLAAALRAQGVGVIEVAHGEAVAADASACDLRQPAQVSALLGRLEAVGSRASRLVWWAPAAGAGDDADALLVLLALGRALVERAQGSEAPRLVVGAGATEDGDPDATAWGLAAAARTMAAETPSLRVRVVVTEGSPSQAATACLAELAASDTEPLVVHRGGQRCVLRHATVEAPAGAAAFVRGGVYLVAGGSGRLGQRVAERLVTEHGASVVLVGRRAEDEALRARLAAWARRGAEALYLSHDLSTPAGACAAVAATKQRFGRLDGVVHCAGIVRDGVYFRKSAADARAVCRAKLDVARALDEATRDEALSCFVVFSSMSAWVANRGQSDYAFANGVLEGLARARARRTDRRGATRSIAWPLWREGGMQVGAEQAARAEAQAGLVALPTEEGLALLSRVTAGAEVVTLVAHGHPERFGAVIAPAEPARVVDGAAAPVVRCAGPEPIAIVGLAGTYPRARTLAALWDNLVRGVDCITEVPADRWDHGALFDPVRGVPGRTYGRWGGFLEDMARFDAAHFGISRKEAERMDPQERLLLQTSWQAIEDAGYAPPSWRGRAVGVFAGVMWNHYQLVDDGSAAARPTALLSAVANRVSYALDLRGPSLAVETMCSSSLTAVHLAVESLRRGECEAALAGGVNVIAHPERYLQLAHGQFLSDDGRCRSFGADGTGYVPGEGVGVLVLMPLAEARAQRLPIRAVLRGSWLGHGGRTSGFTVPDPAAQARVIRAALWAAGVAPKSITYVEAHGTGTSLGDPIEIKGLVDGYGAAARELVVGSVKSNLGHLEGAAGVAGLTKVVLQLQHRQIVPSLHAEPPNPHIDFAAARVRVARALEAWRPAPGHDSLRAGVSAFGAGGSNVHIVVESHPPAPPTPSGEGPFACVLSAGDDETLRRYARDLLDFVDERTGAGEATEPRLSLADLTYTLQLGRAPLRRRLAVVVRSLAELRRALAAFVDGQSPPHASAWWGDPGATPAVGPSDGTASVERLAAGWQAGADVDWASLYDARALQPRRISLPTYPFRGEVCWLGRWKAGETGAPLVRTTARTDTTTEERTTIMTTTRDRATTEGPGYHGDEVELTVLDDGIALLMLQDEAHGNMLTPGLLEGLAWAFARVERDPRVRVVVLSNRGPAFCMGGTPQALEAIVRGQSRFTDAAIVYEGALRCPVPVIAAMGGHASGGGLMLGLYADLVIMARDAVYGATFLRYGFTPGMGATYTLERRVGRLLAAEMLLTGRGLGGEELERRGAGVVFRPADEVLPHALELARTVAEQPSAAVRALKAELADQWLCDLPRAIGRELAMHEQVLDEDALARIRRHFERGEAEPVALRAPARPSAAAPVRVAAEPEPAPVRLAPAPVPARVALAPLRVAAEPEPARVAAEPQAEAERRDRRRAQVLREVEEILGATLYLREGEIDRERPFSEMGVDSIGVVTIVRDLNERFATSLDSVALYEHSTVARLVEHVVEVLEQHERSHAAALRRDASPEPLVAASSPRPAAAPAPEASPEPLVAAPVRLASSVAPEPPERWSASTRLTLPPTRVETSVCEAEAPVRERERVMRAPAPRTPVEDRSVRGTRPVAVIGMAGRFPDAPDLAAFWANLVTGRDSVREVPPQRWSVERFYDPDGRAAGKTISKWAALLDDVDRFDARLFNISPLEAEAMDPQQRLFLEQAWAALEDAGYAAPATREAPCGVFVGCAAGDYAERLAAHGRADTGEGFLGTASSVLAARIAYVLDLAGPTVAIDTACSSSLVAVHLACEAIRSGQCGLALAGGVALMFTHHMHVRSSKIGILSPRGRCAPFDTAADGTVLGEGVGVVVLKDLERALADGDHIHGVIRGSGINGDGKTNGITAPSAGAQARLLARVWRDSGISADELGYVEAHGTGTELGDPIEVKALIEAMGPGARGAYPCALGSLKSSIGHTTLAAGIGGLLKVLLALRHATLPPTVHFRALNPKIDLSGTRLFVDAAPRPWAPGPRGERMAGVSSFGFSGTNAHVVVSGPPAQPDRPRAAAPGPVVVPLSAKTPSALARRVADLAASLDAWHRLQDVAFTLAMGRCPLPYRAAFVAADVASLRDQLEAWPRPAVEPVLHSAAAIEAAVADIGAERSVRILAEAHVAGADVPWARAFATGRHRRVPLPTYPFEGGRYWLPDRGPSQRPVVHPWLGAPGEEGQDGATAFTVHLDPEDPHVADHRVHDRPVLPGAACVELAAAVAAEGPLEVIGLRWLEPVVVERPLALRLSLEPRADGFDFRLHAEGDAPRLHASGSCRAGVPDEPAPALALDEIRRRCPRRLDDAELYAAFARAGLRYGPAFQRLAEVHVGRDEALGRIVAGATLRHASGMRLDPTLLDAVWQSIVALTWDRGQTASIPFAMDSVAIREVPSGTAWAHVRRRQELCFDIEVADAHGRSCIFCTGLRLRPLAAAAPPRVAATGPVHAPPAPPPRTDASGREPSAGVLAYVRQVFAEVLKYPALDLDPESTFESYGVDSMIGTKIIDRLSDDLGELPATLLFEHMTLASLAAALASSHGEALRRLVAPAAEEPAPRREAPPAAAVILARDVAPTAPDIAVVGVCGRYPRSPDVDALWDNLANGVDCIEEIPTDRWDWRAYADEGAEHGIYSRWGGFLDDVQGFDAAFFNILPRDAVDMDPQERLFLETAWTLLEQAGALGKDTHVSRTGVFVGVMYGSYGQLAATRWPRGEFPTAHSAHWSIANRVSYFFDFHGPSYAVDSACSSSLTAVHLACESLRNGECEQAIAGGVNLILHPAHYAALCSRRMLARDAQCKVFDERADGYIPGEGVGAVLLKPLHRAEADGDTIWGVIKGSLVNAGGKTSGYTVPNPNAQAELLERAMARAGVDPRTISYVEAHGTGTALGDPIEVASLAQVFRARRPGAAPCAIGSVKANVGHLEGAAGIVGLTKVLLQLRHRTLAPCVNLVRLNPRIDLDRAPVAPQRQREMWAQPRVVLDDGVERIVPRRAGVSSFGAGGANAHVVVEEHVGDRAPASAFDDAGAGEQLFLLSARTAEDLRAMARRMAEHVARGEDSLVSLAYTSQVGRRAMPHRAAVLAASRAELEVRLRQLADGRAELEGTEQGLAEPGGGRHGELLAGEDGHAFVERLLARGDRRRLAMAWVAGIELPWAHAWSGRRPPRARLPGYPFQRKRCWLEAPVEPAQGRPRQEVTRREHRLDPAHFICVQHRVRGKAWVPGMAWLEIIRRQLPPAEASACACFEHVAWPGALAVETDDPRVVVELRPAGDGLEFRVEAPDAAGDERGGMAPRQAAEGSAVLARGVIRAGAEPAAGRWLDLEGAKARAAERMDADAFYRRCEQGGLEYGPALRVVRELWIGEREVLARLEARDAAAGAEPVAGLRFDLADGLLQAVVALEHEGRTFLPTRIRRLDVASTMSGRGWVHVVEVDPPTGAPRGSRSFDITFAAYDGTVELALEGLATELARVRAAPSAARPESPPAGPPEDPAAARDEPEPELALRAMASRFLLVDPSEVDLDASLDEQGFDSLSLVELVEDLNETYALDLAPQVLFDCPTLRAIGRFLSTHHGDAIRLRAASVTPLAPAAAEPVALASAPVASAAAPVASVPVAPASAPAPVAPSQLGLHGIASASASPEIAIIGAAAILPGSRDLEELWAHLVAGDDLVGPVPASRPELLALGEPPIRGGFVDDVDRFDAAFFRVSPREAALMDPQQRLFLEVAYRAIESTGHPVSSLAGTATGLFVGVGTSDYADLLREHGGPVVAHCATGIAHSILANRVSHLLDLHGPSEAIDTACSSSLVAIHRAVRSLVDGECEVAIAGGVNVMLSPALFQAFADSGMLSPDGKCKTFDAAADGYVRGEGSGAIVLKPLARARADGDDVLAIVRGSAVGHGGRAQSLTAPSPAAQERVLVDAYFRSGIDPATVSYIEAHGTGTKLGDPVEVEALVRAFSRLQRDHGSSALAEASIGLGSIKTNLGHLEAAAGIAGVLKVVLAMRHRQLPAMLHFRTQNPHLRLAGTPFFVQARTTPWRGRPDASGRLVLRAGVSSFGFGGTNAHVVLEAPGEPEATAPGVIPAAARFLPLSAPTLEGVRTLAHRLAARLDEDPAFDPSRLVFTFQLGRDHFPSRVAIRFDDPRGLVRGLEAVAAGRSLPGSVYAPGNEGAPPPTAPWLAGGFASWDALWPSPRPLRLAAPGCPWTKQRYWVETPAPVREEPRAPQRPAGAAVVRPKLRLAPAAARREDEGRPAVAASAGVAPARAVGAASAAPERAVAPAAGAAPARVVDFIVAELSAILGTSSRELPHDRSFTELGLDSIFGMQLVRRLSAAYHLELAAAEIYDHDTIERLASHVQRRLDEAAPPIAALALTDPTAVRAPPTAAPAAAVSDALQRTLRTQLEAVLGSDLDPDRSFAEQLTSFDMLRAINVLERRFGSLRKNLLFVHADLAALARHLLDEHGLTALRVAADGPAAAPEPPPPVLSRALDGDGPWLLAKATVAEVSALRAVFERLEQQHGKEGGLPNRDISPLVFLASGQQAYFNCARRGRVLFAFSSVAAEADFPGLAQQFVAFARAHGLSPNFLSLLRLERIGEVELSATPFGVVQRLDGLAGFDTKGQAKRQLRYMIGAFSRGRRCRTVEYVVGSSAQTDREIVEMIDRWCETKTMINPYVYRVRDELARGQLDPRHRMFLTYADDALANAVILTSIPSENGYLLDLEFYPAEIQGGLEYALVQLFDRLAGEGCSCFSFGGTFGVKVCESINADPETEAALEELRREGIFDGRGNFQFKNKFRPTNVPIYLCRPVGPEATPVSEIILMIASPTVGASTPARRFAPPAEPGPHDASEPAGRERLLERYHHNPLALPGRAVTLDLSTDSWAELTDAFVEQHVSALRAQPPLALEDQDTLPFDFVVPVGSGRDAEALLCAAMPQRGGVVLTNGLFPSWSFGLLDGDFSPQVLRPAHADADARFRADVDLDELERRLAEAPDAIAFVCLELSNNACGGHPLSLANLRAVRERLEPHGIHLVLDATRLLENAYFVAEHELGRAPEDAWAVARELLAVADTVTLSLTKDFATNFGGVLATRDPRLAAALRERVAMRGHVVNASNRQLVAAALAQRTEVARLVRQRMDAVASLWTAMRARGLPIAAPAAGHCVVLDVATLPGLAGLRNPVPSLLAELYRAGGVRAAPHLAPAGSPMAGHVRLAVPVGLAAARLDAVADVLAAVVDPAHRLLDLELVDTDARWSSVARYRPRLEVSPAIREALATGRTPRGENAEVLHERCPDVERRIVSLPDGEVEAFLVGAGPPVLLMHPFNIGAGIFADQLEALRDRYRLVVIHHPGVGATTAAPDLSLDGLCELFAATLERLGIEEPLHLVGASVGGLEAQAFALRHPERVASLTLLCSSYRVGNRNGAISPLADVVRDDFAALVERSPVPRAERDAQVRRLLRCESMSPPIGLRYLDEFALDPGLLPRLPQLRCPVQVVHGRHDTVIDRVTSRTLLQAIAGAEWVELDDAGHFPSLTDPERCTELLRSFFDAHPPPPPGAAPSPPVALAEETAP